MANIQRDPTGAPKAGAPSSKFQQQLKKVLSDSKKVEELKEAGKTSIFYDHQSPGVRDRRKRARQEFEWFVATHLDMDPPDYKVIWNVDTFTEYTKLWLSCVGTWITGRIGNKPKAGVLFQRKDAIYWWAIRQVDGFTQIYGRWHAELVGLITYTADTEGFEKGHYQKNVLELTDIALFFKALKTYPRGRDNWRQNYVMWILVFFTGVRPGSFTVSKGYEKGAPLGDGSNVRPEDETLRWSDAEFRRTEKGLIVRVTFRYLKGQRKSHDSRKTSNATKTWTFVPSTSSRYEFDPALLLTGLAFSRGLFKSSTLDQFMNDDSEYPAVNEEVNRQAIFVQASNKDEKLLPDVAMRLSSVNDKLKKICADHGYYGRNTMYSFRRAALIETKRKHGTEYAAETAAHKPEGRTLYDYDVVGQGDIDWTADRLDQSGLSRKVIRDLYSQSAVGKIDTAPSALQNARADELSIRTDNKMQEDPTYISLERQLQEKLDEIGVLLEDEVQVGEKRQFSQYLEMLQEGESVQHATMRGELQELLKLRKNLKKNLRSNYAQVVKEEMLQEHKRNMKIAREAARPKVNVMKDQRVDSRAIVDAADQRIADEINNLPATVNEDDESSDDEEVDPDALDDLEDRDMVQPEWADIPDDVELVVNQDDDEDLAATDAGRLAFLRNWVQQTSDQTSNLPCLSCQLDDTVPQARKDERHTMYKLNRHLKSDYHSRLNQLLRAFSIDSPGIHDTRAACPLCDRLIQKKFFGKHVEAEHPEQL